MTVWYILLAILGLSVLVITHELGHYLMGKWLGFTIMEFSVGLGPKIFGIKGKETEFTLRALPIGGSCRFFGEDGKEDDKDKKHPDAFEEDEEVTETEPEPPDERLFSSKPAWKRFLVVLSGPLTNIITCVVLSFVILLAFGKVTEGPYFLRIGEFLDDSPAEEAGAEIGDIIVSLNGKQIDEMTFGEVMKNADPTGTDIVILRGAKIEEHVQEEGLVKQTDITVSGGTEMTLHLSRLAIDQKTGNKLIGIRPNWKAYSSTEEKFTVGTAALRAFPETWETGKLVYESIKLLVQGKASCRDMAGFVGLVDAVSETVSQAGTASDATEIFLSLMALIAVNLGIVNLLPLPALDGGRLVFIVLEMIRRKPVPPEKEGMVHLIGMLALLLLMAVLTINDIMRCFGG